MRPGQLWKSDQYNYLILILNVDIFHDDFGNVVSRVIHQRVGKDVEGNPLLEYRNNKKWYLYFRTNNDLGNYTHCQIFGIVKWNKFKEDTIK